MWSRPAPSSTPPAPAGKRLSVRWRVAGAVAAFTIVLAGCAADEGPEAGSDAELVSRAFARAAQEQTARIELTSQMSVDAAGAQELLSSEEVALLQEGLTAASATLEGAIDFPRRQGMLGTSSDDGAFEPVAVFDDLRMHMPRHGDDSQPWAVADFEDERMVVPEGDELPIGVTALSPYVLMELLTGVSEANAEPGTESGPPGDAPTTPYDVVIDWSQVLDDHARDEAGIERLDDARRGGLMRIHEAMGLGTDESVTLGRVWLDDEGLPRRLSWAVGQPLELPGELEGSVLVELTLTLEVLDFGVPVDIAVPTADEVVEAQGFADLVRGSWVAAAAGGSEPGGGQAGAWADAGTAGDGPRRPPPGFPPPANDPAWQDPGRPSDGRGDDGPADRRQDAPDSGDSGDDLGRYDIPPEVRRQIEEQQGR